MKELSIEEKAKRYDEAIEIAKEINNEQRAQPFNVMTRVFPELKESDDEKIRKVLIDFFRNELKKRGDEEWDWGFHTTDVIAWLENQGEHARFRRAIQVGDQVTKNEDGVLVNLSQLKRVAKPRQKPTNKVKPKFKVGDKIWHKNYKGECIHHIIRIENDNYIGDNNISISISTADKEYELVEKQDEQK